MVGKKPHHASKSKREKWYREHPGLTRKEFAKSKRAKRSAKKTNKNKNMLFKNQTEPEAPTEPETPEVPEGEDKPEAPAEGEESTE